VGGSRCAGDREFSDEPRRPNDIDGWALRRRPWRRFPRSSGLNQKGSCPLPTMPDIIASDWAVFLSLFRRVFMPTTYIGRHRFDAKFWKTR